MPDLDRRSFLKAGSATLLATTGLQAISTRMAEAAPGNPRAGRRNARADYGPLTPMPAVNSRDYWLALPAGFSYSVFGTTGAPMSDGTVSPRAHDGMGAFTSASGAVTLIRNQEIRFSLAAPYSQGQYVITAPASCTTRAPAAARRPCASTPASSARPTAGSSSTSSASRARSSTARAASPPAATAG